MPGYVGKALKQFGHNLQKKQDQPYPSTPIKYEAKKQYVTQQSTAALLWAESFMSLTLYVITASS